MVRVLKNSKSSLIALILLLAIALSFCVYSFTEAEQTVSTSESVRSEKLTVIIDAGHGGADGGAVSSNGAEESKINLAIALKLQQILCMYGVNVIMTRTTEAISYPDNAKTIAAKKVADQKNRLKVINQTEYAVLISIHQNKFTSAGPFGAQVLFSETRGSEEIAIKLQQLLIDTIDKKNYRVASKIPDTIYLMNNIKCPAILVECGFLSNPSEEAALQDENYQLKLALTLAAGYLQSEDALMEIYFGGTNES